MKNVLIPLAPWFEEIEIITVVDIHRRSGARVSIAGVVEGVIEGSRGVKLLADDSINNINSEKFNSMILHGGQPWTDNVKKILGSLHFYRKWKVKKNNRCNLCGTNYFRGKWAPQKTLKNQSSIGQRNIIRGFVYGEQRWLTTKL